MGPEGKDRAPAEAETQTPIRWRPAAALLLAVHAALLAWSAACHSPTLDELGHLAGGVSHWSLGTFDLFRVNPPLVRMTAAIPVHLARPALDWRSVTANKHARCEFAVGRDFFQANGERTFFLLRLARWACIPFSVLGGWVCWRWAAELYGSRAALLALALWCFCPNLLGHGSLIAADTGATALGAFAGYRFWKWCRDPNTRVALLAGIALGLAELAKFTWVVLVPLWPLAWLLVRGPTLWRGPGRASRREAAQLGLILLTGWLVLNLGYGFEGCFQPLGSYDFASRALGSAGPSGDQAVPNEDPLLRMHLLTDPRLYSHGPSNRFADTWLAALPVPLPENYLYGIDQQREDFERNRWSYLRGQWHEGGWWYYYLYALAVKVPLGTWGVVLLAVALRLRGRLGLRGCDELLLLAPAAAVLVLTSSQTGINHHLRYVLPVLPFVFVWASGAAERRGTALLALVAGCATVVSSIAVYPHGLSYFNELAGGPMHGHAHLIDSNIDWGQDLFYLKRWLDEHPEARPLHLAYLGPIDPRSVGIEYTLPPLGPVDEAREDDPPERGPQPGWHAVSVAFLRGYRSSAPDGHGDRLPLERPLFRYFLHFRPLATAGYSIYIYHLTLDETNRVRQELGLPSLHP
jgi:hypothetical protein